MRKVKLLIVEDEAMFAMVLKNNLQLRGYQVCEPVSTGLAAIQAAIDEQPEAVLMDIRLVGEMDGIAAAEQILSSRRVPIIFMTGYSDEKTEARARA
jgi:two-component system, response regulator PdtaR